MMLAAILTVILMVHCPFILAIPATGHALSPLLQHAEQCTHALSTVVHLGDTTPWLEHISDVVHGQPVSDETSLIIYDTAKTQTIHKTCPVSSKPSRPAIDVLLTIEGPIAVQASQVHDDSSITQHSSTDWITTAGSPQSTAIVLLTIDGPISIKAGGKGGLEPTLPNHLKLPICAATAFRGHSPINQTIIMADQPNLLSSEIETTLVPQGFRLAYLLHHSKLYVDMKDSKANTLQSPQSASSPTGLVVAYFHMPLVYFFRPASSENPRHVYPTRSPLRLNAVLKHAIISKT